ncbi:unnamed protein product [Rangifer tarandus platyrhynchus]|uniref:Uncharacterized protein n=2 Tax=Rangifer tarandus platyrhynchus TaxID=3082113 RepID=A0ABN8ZJD4_RANTA|nr:unnamed protein product [Rangifer tarandus platyrhynchus]CAI9706154.1 unnamed protein product [Rangifer tarandus platyrhynchus]
MAPLMGQAAGIPAVCFRSHNVGFPESSMRASRVSQVKANTSVLTLRCLDEHGRASNSCWALPFAKQVPITRPGPEEPLESYPVQARSTQG